MVKKVLAGLLVLGVGIVWIPQLLSAKVDTKPVVAPEVPAYATTDLDAASNSTDGTDSKGSTTSKTPTNDGESAAANTSTNTTADGAQAGAEPAVVVHEDLGASLDTALSRARKLLSTQGGADHLPTESDTREEQHEPATAQVPSTGVAVDASNSNGILRANLGSESGDIATEQDPIATFLSTHPLQGTVIGASDRVATMGPLLVRVGDEPVRGLVVTTIASRYVEMRRDGGGEAPATIRVDLEPFRARASSTTTGTSGSNGGGANAGGANAGNTTNTAGGADAGNVAAANAGLDRLLPQLQNANRALEDAAKAATGKTTGANTGTGTPNTNTSNGVGTTGATNVTPKTTTNTGSGTNTSTNAANGNKEPHGS